MRAIVMTAFGGPEVLRLTDIPEPEPEHGQFRRPNHCYLKPLPLRLLY